MSFETLKVAELRKIAEDFAVDTDGIKSKTDIVAALAEEGVTWSVYQKTIKDIEDATKTSVNHCLVARQNLQSLHWRIRHDRVLDH